MKKLMMAAVVAMFAVSVQANEAKSKMTEVAGATADSCKAEKNTWKNGKCWKSETTAASTTSTTTTTTAPAAEAAPAAKTK